MSFEDPFDVGDVMAPVAARPVRAAAVPVERVPPPVVEPPLDPEPPRPSDEVLPRPVQVALTPAQRVTFEDLLNIGGSRPVAPPGLAAELTETLRVGTQDALAASGQSLWFSKSMLSEARRCEGLVVANAAASSSSAAAPVLHQATMVGIVAHRAIQLCSTHPGEVPAYYVKAATLASRNEDGFGVSWSQLCDAERSDVQMAATSRLVSFMDSWPVLRDEWVWRFEESTQAKVGALTLAARTDLTLGRPRADGRQTMLLCDLKTGALNDDHYVEAMFYALVATLRWGVPPWRSMVYSLASGTWTDPDVSAVSLRAVADAVVAAVNSRLAVLSEERAPVLTPGVWCRFCPVSSTCESGPVLAPQDAG